MAPSRIVKAAALMRRWGPSPAAGYALSAIRSPNEPAVIDEAGSTSFSEIHARSNSLAHALRKRGIGPGDAVALLCRNHRGFLEATVAIAQAK